MEEWGGYGDEREGLGSLMRHTPAYARCRPNKCITYRKEESFWFLLYCVLLHTISHNETIMRRIMRHFACHLQFADSISRRIGVRPLVVIRELIHLRSPALLHYCCMLQGSGSGEDDCTWLHNTILLLYAAVSSAR